ncbi:hypothetical protein DM02DRAFT_655195 [Periconia macrospinosa]|uniref:Uncharacterized protein n=1 Tax=Periconia macrospinosa TaxID=97972 RepID=A0A2V1DR97_9PLEO|nr:hypothetical protein DM02DRAFT_655195 [Periconia macrospinosa]
MHIEFQCDQVRGFTAAYVDAMRDPANLHMGDAQLRTTLCENEQFAEMYQFKALAAFRKEEGLKTSSDFDWDSIMLYSSDHGAEEQCMDNISKCPMARKPSILELV